MAASITSSSRILPPGSITFFTPAAAAACKTGIPDKAAAFTAFEPTAANLPEFRYAWPKIGEHFDVISLTTCGGVFPSVPFTALVRHD